MVHVLAFAGCVTYFVFNAVDAAVDQENGLVLVKLSCFRLSRGWLRRNREEGSFCGWDICVSL